MDWPRPGRERRSPGSEPPVAGEPSSPVGLVQQPAAKGTSGAAESSAFVPLALPRGGGAIRSIGETYSVNAATGTLAISVPLTITPGRNAFGPRLQLSYDSGAGNGPCGMGWSLSLAAVSRRTDKRLPLYRDVDDSDLFMLTGGGELVPGLRLEADSWVADVRTQDGYVVRRYRPRVETGFELVERWTRQSDGDAHWRVRSVDNSVSIFGISAAARIADPVQPGHVLTWLLERVEDDRGDIVAFDYKGEDLAGVSSSATEAHRLNGSLPVSATYLKRVHYGNNRPGIATDWLFELVLDYGEHDPDHPTSDESRAWPVRQDPFSSFRAGFDLRTYRLCRRFLMFHRLPELGASPCLVGSTDLVYDETATASLLIAVTHSSWVRTVEPDTYERASLPPLQFEYVRPRLDPQLHELAPVAMENLPEGLDGARYRWEDLDGEGLSGFLTEQAGSWYYKRNLGEGSFGPLETVAERPATAALADAHQQILDLAGDGRRYLVHLGQELAGSYRRGDDGWEPFVPFASVPNIDWQSPELRFVDLDGDGRADLLFSGDDAFLYHPSLGASGWGNRVSVGRIFDEERGPTLLFSETSQSVFLADMDGDGLADLVRVRNGETSYWANLGYGRFGAKIAMSGAPVFEDDENFDAARLRLADIDGSGTTDLIYLGRNGASYWINNSGNSWSSRIEVPTFRTIAATDSAAVVDLLGRGTASLVRSSPLPGPTGHPMAYVDLMADGKPYLLQSMINNTGSRVTFHWAPSTKFYLADRLAGRPWATRLPFPIQVLEKAVVEEQVTGSRYLTARSYHHGRYDHEEHEFAGFAEVLEVDTEDYPPEVGAGLFTAVPEAVEEALHVRPALVRSVFHTGAYLEADRLAAALLTTDYSADGAAPRLKSQVLEVDPTPGAEREAVRALRGKLLRQEVYGLDATAESIHPYRVRQQSYEVRQLQPPTLGRAGSFVSWGRESLDLHYERRHDDPRIEHRMALEVDQFGSVIKSAQLCYPRRTATEQEQQRSWITYREADLRNSADPSGTYRLGVSVETQEYELTGQPSGVLLDPAGLRAAIGSATEIPFESPPSTGLQRRLIARGRTTYWDDNLTVELPLGQFGRRAIPYESYAQAFTAGLLDSTFASKVTDLIVGGEGGYLKIDGAWWTHAGHRVFDAASFYLPVASVDPFGRRTEAAYDPHLLAVVSTTDPLQNQAHGELDYRALKIKSMTDPNGNVTECAFDTLGMVSAIAERGKPGIDAGSTLADPSGTFDYDLDAWRLQGKPCFAYSREREAFGPGSRWRERYLYFDGMGREVMAKAQAEPGLAPQRDSSGNLVLSGGKLVMADTSPNPRWVGSGRTTFNAKGLPVKQYEPFFSSTPAYEDDVELVQAGVTPLLHYDALGRLIRRDEPDGSFATFEIDAWTRREFDRNDTVLQSRWYSDRIALDPSNLANRPAIRAAHLAAAHADTPVVAELDPAGRSFLTSADNGQSGVYRTLLVLDVQGNHRAVVDARGRTVLTQDFDMLGRAIHLISVDAGESWLLQDVAGRRLRSWDGRQVGARTAYDEVGRVSRVYSSVIGGPETLAELNVYGEAIPGAVSSNLRTRPYRVYDTAGCSTNAQYDFRGNLLRANRRNARDYKSGPDWSSAGALTDPVAIAAAAEPQLEPDSLEVIREYDALNRLTRMVTPDASEVRPGYNEAALLERVDVALAGSGSASYISDLDYDARGQRQSAIVAGGLIRTDYAYDSETFRLTGITTTSTTGARLLQSLTYTYDPVGNVTEVGDAAQQTLFFANAMVSPNSRYEYDAIYRLTRSEGREHAGLVGHEPPDDVDWPLSPLPDPADLNALRNYAESYSYDELGNLLKVVHSAGSAGWTRRYGYSISNNQLQATSLPGDPAAGPYSATYDYDSNGNMRGSPNVSTFTWDFKNRLRQADLGGGGTMYCVYDAAGQRVRKVIERVGGTVEDRIYFGPYELYRLTSGGQISVQRESLHVMDSSRRVALVETSIIEGGAVVAPRTPLVRYQFSNHLDSACLEVDGNGDPLSYEEYFAFGGSSYRSLRTGSAAKRYRFIAAERDDETGLYYFGSRYYPPWLGRWISPDPEGMADGVSLYTYARNNPVRLIDPDGRDSRDPFALDPQPNLMSIDTSGRLTLLPLSGRALTLDPNSKLQFSSHVFVLGSGGDDWSGGLPAGPAPPPERTFWNRGGAALVGGGILLGVGILILASNPVGWFVLLSGALAVSMGGATTLAAGVLTINSYAGNTTYEQDQQTNQALMLAESMGTPTGMVAAPIAMAATGSVEDTTRVANIAGLVEGGATLTYGLGSMAYREYQFSRLTANLTSTAWQDVSPAVRQAYGYGARSGTQFNPLFNYHGQSIEFTQELSHFASQRSTRGMEWLTNRPWNIRVMSGTEHALVDPMRWRFMTQGFKAAYAGEQLGGLPRLFNLAPEWMLQAGYGATRTGQSYFGLELTPPSTVIQPTPQQGGQ